jgi:hypothetical protein
MFMPFMIIYAIRNVKNFEHSDSFKLLCEASLTLGHFELQHRCHDSHFDFIMLSARHWSATSHAWRHWKHETMTGEVFCWDQASVKCRFFGAKACENLEYFELSVLRPQAVWLSQCTPEILHGRELRGTAPLTTGNGHGWRIEDTAGTGISKLVGIPKKSSNLRWLSRDTTGPPLSTYRPWSTMNLRGTGRDRISPPLVRWATNFLAINRYQQGNRLPHHDHHVLLISNWFWQVSKISID